LDLHASFAVHRALLWRLCYRMTGSAADADDLVQDTFTRALEQPPPDGARELKPWLVQVALNLSRDHLRRRKRRGYVGPWLPSPIETEGRSLEQNPEARYGELESVSIAFLTALEALSARQRAVLVLCDVLGHSVREAAALLAMSESNVKTTHHRARAALAAYDAARLPLTRELQEQTQAVLSKLLLALAAGDVSALQELLAEDVRSLNDGGGEFFAARIPLIGAQRVIKFHTGVRRGEPARAQLRQLNGLPALLVQFERELRGAASRCVFSIALNRAGRVQEIYTLMATRKLSHVAFPR
jgi:RNA polymerase sigma-70 factor (ECF subfamily)